jgi:hypothetical protein
VKKYLFLLLAAILLGGCQLLPVTEENRIQASPESSNNSACGKESCPLETPLILPTVSNSGEKTVEEFFTLINNQKPEEAVAMLSDFAAPDQPTKNFWLDNFASLRRAKIISIDKWNEGLWTSAKEVYKTIVDVQTATGELQYGWENGQNTRWIEVVKQPKSDSWQINQIGTGP